MVSVEEVKRLRAETGAGVMDAKRALDEASGDFDQARVLLRERGMAVAAKRSDRSTGQGLVEAYVHGGGRIGALVELNCETDFVARTDEFRTLARDIAMQVAAMNPAGLTPEDVGDDVAGAKEVAAMNPQALSPEEFPDDGEGDPNEQSLLTQSYIREPGRSIGDLIQEVIAKTGENIRVSRFERFELGDS